MATSLDVAQFIYDELGWVDAWKLAKLTYYCEAWHQAWFGEELVSDSFEAWKDGPVAPLLHRVNKYERESFTGTKLPGADVSQLTAVNRAAIKCVIAHYGAMSKGQLIEQTHSEEPWLKARKGLGDSMKSNQTISRADMRRFYALQEARGASSPARSDLDGTFPIALQTETFEKNIDRWSGALELLAER